jgi:ABC-type transport system involved in cytochrome c biogenesis ATPase subunit
MICNDINILRKCLLGYLEAAYLVERNESQNIAYINARNGFVETLTVQDKLMIVNRAIEDAASHGIGEAIETIDDALHHVAAQLLNVVVH